MGISTGRRFGRAAWLVLAGVVVGAAIGGGFYLYAWKYAPRYTASLPFAVLARMTPIGAPAGGGSVRGLDDTGFVIRSQEKLFKEDAFLAEILKDDEFRMDPAKPKETKATSRWLQENGPNPKCLKRDLVVAPDMDAGMFELRMSAKDPGEAASMLQAAARVYMRFLTDEAHGMQETRQVALLRALQREEDDFKVRSDALSVWASSKNIDVQRSKFDIEKAALMELNSDYIKAQAQADSSEAYYMSLRAMREDVEKNGGEIELTPEMERQIENDPTLRSLNSTRLSIEQDKAAEEGKRPANMDRVGELTARITKVDEQIKELNTQLRKIAGKRMEELAKNQMIGDHTRAQKIDAMRQKKEEMVRSLGADLGGYEQRLIDLRQQQSVLNDLRKESQLADVNRLSDNLRVKQMIETADIPKDPDLPDWRLYFPTGAAGGLLLGLLGAGLTGGSSKRSTEASSSQA